jgi:hypothetical protein
MALGACILTATAKDAAGNSAIARIAVTIADGVPPVVALTSPSNGATVSGTISVQASASDNVGVARVEFRVDGNLVATDSLAPYSFNWNTTGAANGGHTLTAKAYDEAGNSASSQISVTVSNEAAPPAGDTTAPQICITSPLDEAVVGATNLSVCVNTSDNVGVVKVELYVDGKLQASSSSSPFTIKWNTRKASIGPHTLQSKAYDAAGNVGVSPAITVYR